MDKIIPFPESKKQKPECRRCGTCCSKGGPVLHLEDKALVNSGKIPARCLYTIRKYEPVWDNVKNRVHPTDTELIKIKEKPGSKACLFYDTSRFACTIHPDRPIQCRILFCTDTRAIESVYDQNRLSRADLLSHVPGLWDLIVDHEKHCDLKQISETVKRKGKIKNGEDNPVLAVHYDLHLRNVLEQRGTNVELMDFSPRKTIDSHFAIDGDTP